MDKSTIVITVNIAYCVVYMILLIVRHQQYRNLVVVHDKNPKVPFEYTAYTLGFGLLLPLMATFPLIRNHHIFDYSFPIQFIIQFSAQFLILILFILDTKITRHMATYGIGVFFIFMFLNGLFRMEPEYSKLELTTLEIQKLSKDLQGFSDDVSERIQKVNIDMKSVAFEISERQKQIDIVNGLLKEKQNEYESVRKQVEVDKEKAVEILKALGVKQPTLSDRLADAGMGAILGLFVSIIWNRFFGEKARAIP